MSDVLKTKSDTILVVGLVCMDIILVCTEYPKEDSGNRALDCIKRRGGNGSNSCTVLSVLGCKNEILAPIGGDLYAEFLKRDLEKHNIIYKNCPVHSECETPFTHLINSLATGSRTGVHVKNNFPENSFEDFTRLNLDNYTWIHFEGRCPAETVKMINFVNKYNEKKPEKAERITCSVELEKCKSENEKFIPLVDYVFVSKAFAQYLGYHDMRSTINGMTPNVKHGAVIIVPWGESGAMARSSDGQLIETRAFPPENVLDSVGAGDTFIAATICFLSKGKSLKSALTFACQIAGAKVGMNGFEQLRERVPELFKLCT